MLNQFNQFSDKSCFEEDVTYPGGDIWLTRLPVANSPEECQVACAASNECKLWTYKKYRKTKQCILRLGTDPTIGLGSYFYRDMTAGPKICGKFNLLWS